MTKSQILGLIVLGMPVLFGLTFLVTKTRQRSLLNNGIRTTGTVLATEFRRGSEGGGAWVSNVEFVDRDGVRRERWLGGRYVGVVEIVHHPNKWKRAAIVGGEVVGSNKRWVQIIALGVLGAIGLGTTGAGVLLLSGVWSPRIGEPDLVAVCDGAGSGQNAELTAGPAPHPVVAVDVETGSLVDIGLATGLGWDSRSEPWHAELVLCLDRVNTELVDNCRYEDRVLNLFDSDYELTLRQATSAEVLDTDEWSSEVDRQCPFVAFFRESDPLVTPRYSTELFGITRFLRPFVEP